MENRRKCRYQHGSYATRRCFVKSLKGGRAELVVRCSLRSMGKGGSKARLKNHLQRREGDVALALKTVRGSGTLQYSTVPQRGSRDDCDLCVSDEGGGLVGICSV